MSESVSHSEQLRNIVGSLAKLSREKGIAFMIATQSTKTSPIRISHSTHFSDTHVRQVERVLEDKSFRITAMMPFNQDHKELLLSRTDSSYLISQYFDLFTCLTQKYCKEIAKEWVKVVEPRKQALYPYKLQDDSRPPWWPTDVDHIEPDHLDKDGRVKLLISILRDPLYKLELLKEKSLALQLPNKLSTYILNELFYIAAYDRLFYNHFREEDPLFYDIPPTGRKGFSEDQITIMVSNLKRINKNGSVVTLMLSQIEPEEINCEVFELQRQTPEPKYRKRKSDFPEEVSNKRKTLLKEEPKSDYELTSSEEEPFGGNNALLFSSQHDNPSATTSLPASKGGEELSMADEILYLMDRYSSGSEKNSFGYSNEDSPG
ncbi:hypothetical protein PICST_28778 [Scheffersomyces stipitis CBS 6054]|uniref:Subtelomeric hrmA-associated cluster protein AFUB-079030/YDR124W-like helical bundle domain-containing protein n=1 Tax=Scheffersomyces stipitis (strain ATCC 58785 / CBS 6054 / NBRC 10063 / NRRL Y-11545) TaxID=322104 RepID=A3GGX9_PICST|nr:predicted protein [Scheffersomyces stipitis CBS 6054]EAZ64000.2 hypothetical protein PICST_28778 [Scheffersomyces stipitis CBS 6054]